MGEDLVRCLRRLLRVKLDKDGGEGLTLLAHATEDLPTELGDALVELL